MISAGAMPLLSLGLVGAPISAIGGKVSPESPESRAFAQILALLPGAGSQPAAAAPTAPPEYAPTAPLAVLGKVLPERGNILPPTLPAVGMPLQIAAADQITPYVPDLAPLSDATVHAAPPPRSSAAPVIQFAALVQGVKTGAGKAHVPDQPLLTMTTPVAETEAAYAAPAPVRFAGSQAAMASAAARNADVDVPKAASKPHEDKFATPTQIGPRQSVTPVAHPLRELSKASASSRPAQGVEVQGDEAHGDEVQGDEAHGDEVQSDEAHTDTAHTDTAILQSAQPVAVPLAGEKPLLREVPEQPAIAAIETGQKSLAIAEPAPTPAHLHSREPAAVLPLTRQIPAFIPAQPVSTSAQPNLSLIGGKLAALPPRAIKSPSAKLQTVTAALPARTVQVASRTALSSLAFVPLCDAAEIPAAAIAVSAVLPARVKNNPAAPLIAVIPQVAAPEQLAKPVDEITPRPAAIHADAAAPTSAAPTPATALADSTIAAAATPEVQVTVPTKVERPADFAQIVDRLVTARDLATDGLPLRPVLVSLSHAEFGKVSLHFTADKSGLSVAMASSDPGFAPAVQAAAPSAQQAASGDTSSQSNSTQSAPHGDTGAAQSSAQFSAQSGAQGQPSARQSAADPREARAQPNSQTQTSDGEQATRRRGRFA